MDMFTIFNLTDCTFKEEKGYKRPLSRTSFVLFTTQIFPVTKGAASLLMKEFYCIKRKMAI